MNNLFELLKQFREIEPDQNFSSTSKRAILAAEPARSTWTTRKMIFRIVETTVAFGLTGFFVLLITGSLSGSKIAPMEYAAVDPTTLHAEAQAIDMQIQLAQLNYAENSAGATTAPAASAARAIVPMAAAPVALSGSVSTSTTATSTATSTNVSLDQALEHLSN